MSVSQHALSRAVVGAASVLLTTPDLDGDSVGSIVALHRAISRRWPEKSLRVVVPEASPARYRSLTEGVAFVRAGGPVEAVDLALVVDGGPERLGAAAPHFAAARVRGMIDHHRSSDVSVVDVALLDWAAASTTELVLQLCDRWGVSLDRSLAAPLFAGLAFDTSVFRYRLTSPRALRAAARLLETGIDHAGIVEQVLLQQSEGKARLRARVIDRMHLEASGRLAWSHVAASESAGVDTGGLVDDLVFIEGVEVGLLFVERGPERVKLSLRSRGGVDVASLAQTLSPRGGGHARAAGATVAMDLATAFRDLVPRVAATLNQTQPVSPR